MTSHDSHPPKTLLDLNSDVLHLTCVTVEDDYRRACLPDEPCPPRALLAVALTCKRLREIALPLLYERLFHTEIHASTNPELNTVRFLKVLEMSEAYAQHTRSVVIDKRGVDRRLFARLVAALARLQKLDSLKLLGDGHGADLVLAFSQVEFPRVQTLVIRTSCEHMIPSFPNVQAVRIADTDSSRFSSPRPLDELFSWTHRRSFTDLRDLEFDGLGMDWSPMTLSHIASCIPQLEHIGKVHTWSGDVSYEDSIVGLSHFKQLRSLATLTPMWLGVGDYSVLSACRSCRPQGKRVLCRAHEEKARLHIARLAFENCGTLREVYTAHRGVVVCTRTDDGSIKDMAWNADVQQRRGAPSVELMELKT